MRLRALKPSAVWVNTFGCMCRLWPISRTLIGKAWAVGLTAGQIRSTPFLNLLLLQILIPMDMGVFPPIPAKQFLDMPTHSPIGATRLIISIGLLLSHTLLPLQPCVAIILPTGSSNEAPLKRPPQEALWTLRPTPVVLYLDPEVLFIPHNLLTCPNLTRRPLNRHPTRPRPVVLTSISPRFPDMWLFILIKTWLTCIGEEGVTPPPILVLIAVAHLRTRLMGWDDILVSPISGPLLIPLVVVPLSFLSYVFNTVIISRVTYRKFPPTLPPPPSPPTSSLLPPASRNTTSL